MWRQVVSRSPSKDLLAPTYLRGWALVLTLIQKHGLSLSGREANCCFLNTGDTRFANIATITGLDFKDDARGCAVVDWDRDGDLDLWVSNRTAPQIRYLRNDVPNKGGFLALRLVGTKSSRDAIGARVSLKLADDPKSHIKTLRAGEGFLAQSSKWMHFGLGDQTDIEKITIRWPDGSVDEFADVKADQFYRVVQDAAALQPVVFETEPLKQHTASDLHPSSPAKLRTVVAPREKPLSLTFLNSDGERVVLRETVGSPTLVNLWSETCVPCLKELTEFAHSQAKINQSGLRIIALRSVNPSEDEAESIQQLNSYARKLDLPFEMAAATDFAMKQLSKAQDEVTQIDRPLALPTSFLLDANGRVSVIYRGTVSVEQLLQDVERLSLPESEWNDTCVPLPGRWFKSPFAAAD